MVVVWGMGGGTGSLAAPGGGHHALGDLAERAAGPAPGMAGKWDLRGPWALSARHSMAWRAGLQGGKEVGSGGSGPRQRPSRAWADGGGVR